MEMFGYLILRLFAKEHFFTNGMHHMKATLFKGSPPPSPPRTAFFLVQSNTVNPLLWVTTLYSRKCNFSLCILLEEDYLYRNLVLRTLCLLCLLCACVVGGFEVVSLRLWARASKYGECCGCCLLGPLLQPCV